MKTAEEWLQEWCYLEVQSAQRGDLEGFIQRIQDDARAELIAAIEKHRDSLHYDALTNATLYSVLPK